jgi:O-methyltransferase involved in polyketide biosynthesis
MATVDAVAADGGSSADRHSPVNAVGGTSLITAAFRAIELRFSTSPIIIDPLASLLGKAAWNTAHKDW